MTLPTILTLLLGLSALLVAGAASWLLRGAVDPLAAAAGLTALASLAWNAYAVSRDRPVIRVGWSLVLLPQPTRGGLAYRGPPTHLAVEARNVGRRPVTLSGIGFDLKKSRSPAHLWPDLVGPQLPYELPEGKSYSGLAKLDSIGDFVKATDRFTNVWVRDQTDRYWKTKVSQRGWRNVVQAYEHLRQSAGPPA